MDKGLTEQLFVCWLRSANYKDIDFAKLDVDELNETTSKAGVRVSDTVLVVKSACGLSRRLLIVGG